jgi:hypothetical protein
VADAGWSELGAYGPVYSIAYFQILTLMFRLLTYGRDAMALRTWWWDTASKSNCTLPIPRIRHIAALRANGRCELLQMSAHLMEDWPHRFVDACRATGVSSRQLLRPIKGLQFPFAWWHAVEWNLSATARPTKPSRSHAENAYRPPRKSATNCSEVVELGGDRIAAHRSVTTQGAPRKGNTWRLNGVSTEVRVAARLAADRDGESLASWVEKVLQRTLNKSA